MSNQPQSMKKSSAKHSMLLALAAGLLVLIAVLSYIVFSQSQAQRLKTFERQALSIQQLDDPAQRQQSSEVLLRALDQQLAKDPQQVDIARFALTIAKEYDDQDRQIDYYRYLNKQFLLSREQRVDYIKLGYQRFAQQLSAELQEQIKMVLLEEPQQADVMFILAQQALKDYDYDLAVKGFRIAIQGLHGAELAIAKERLAYAQKKLAQ